ncbi:MAG: tripartite tricarboxylate transporter substrate binding protein [Rhodospirillaceae bacterium]
MVRLASWWSVPLAAAALAAASASASAEYPDRDITMVVGYSAGGGTDIMARTVAPFLEKYLGGDAHIVVKNVPGAGGQLGFTRTATADPDGYTLGTYNLPGAVTLIYDRKATYSPDSFTYLANFVEDPNVFAVKKGSPIKSVADIVALEKKDPGSVTVGLSAFGGNGHLGSMQFIAATGVTFSFVPFKGAAPARTAVMGGHVLVGTQTLSEAQSFGDELKVLAVMADERSPMAPDVPTFKELGYDVEMGSLRGFVAPAGLDAAVRDKLIAAFRATYEDPEFRAAMKKINNPLRYIEGGAFAKVGHKQAVVIGKMWKTNPWK